MLYAGEQIPNGPEVQLQPTLRCTLNLRREPNLWLELKLRREPDSREITCKSAKTVLYVKKGFVPEPYDLSAINYYSRKHDDSLAIAILEIIYSPRGLRSQRYRLRTCELMGS